MKHVVTTLKDGKPVREALQQQRRPFEDYQDQPDTAERMRLAVQSIPFALPEKRNAKT